MISVNLVFVPYKLRTYLFVDGINIVTGKLSQLSTTTSQKSNYFHAARIAGANWPMPLHQEYTSGTALNDAAGKEERAL